jgi:DNA-binding CsgD family transcriptional regulator
MDTGIDYLKRLPDNAPKRYKILVLVSEGYSYNEIAIQRNKAYQTIKNEIYRLQHNVGASNIAHLIHLAHKAGIL